MFIKFLKMLSILYYIWIEHVLSLIFCGLAFILGSIGKLFFFFFNLGKRETLPEYFEKLKIGDVVISANPGNPLHCGSGCYPHAIVIKAQPLILVSEETDMRWSLFPEKDLKVIGRASYWQYFKCLRRLDD